MICSECKADLSITQFYRTKTGIDPICKSCRSKRASENYQKRRVKRLEESDKESKEFFERERYEVSGVMDLEGNWIF